MQTMQTTTDKAVGQQVEQQAEQQAQVQVHQAAAQQHTHKHYEFGMKTAQHIGASLGGSKAERDDAEAQAVERMRTASKPTDWQTRLEAMSLEQRVDATVECLGRRASFARVLRPVMQYCRQDRASEDVEAFIEQQPDFAANRQSARRYLIMLMRTGAIEEVGMDADGNALILNEKPLADETEQGGQGEQADKAETTEPVDESEAAAQPNQTDQREQADQIEQTDAPADPDSADTDPTDPADDLFARVISWRVSLTEAGEQALERTDPLAKLRKLIADEPQDRKDVYLDVLAFCEEPRTLASINQHLAGNPGLEPDQWGVAHIQPSAYIGKLDQAGGLVWADGSGWVTTQGGEQLLDESA